MRHEIIPEDPAEQVVTAGAQYEGGSIRPLIENRLAAELTRDRVYELLTYLN